jgi:hypothetical protein
VNPTKAEFATEMPAPPFAAPAGFTTITTSASIACAGVATITATSTTALKRILNFMRYLHPLLQKENSPQEEDRLSIDLAR